MAAWDATSSSPSEDINGVPHMVTQSDIKEKENKKIIGQVHPGYLPRYHGIATFCKLPLLHALPQNKCDIAVIGIPWDSGCSYRTGARFGPSGIREASRLYRPYNIQMGSLPFKNVQVADAGDCPCTPYGIDIGMKQMYKFCKETIANTKCLVTMGGDHTLSYPVIKAVVDNINNGKPVALIHFDAHLDTYPAVYGQDVWHGSPFRKCFEDKLIDEKHSIHVGVRNSIWDKTDFTESEAMGFDCIVCNDVHKYGIEWTIDRILKRVCADDPNITVYISIDIDVIDVSQAPATGTPEIAGLFTYQLLEILNGLKNLNVISADVVEVSPPYDTNAQITALAATGMLYQLITIMAQNLYKIRSKL